MYRSAVLNAISHFRTMCLSFLRKKIFISVACGNAQKSMHHSFICKIRKFNFLCLFPKPKQLPCLNKKLKRPILNAYIPFSFFLVIFYTNGVTCKWSCRCRFLTDDYEIHVVIFSSFKHDCCSRTAQITCYFLTGSVTFSSHHF